MNIEECTNIKNKDIAAHLKLPPVKLHCRYAFPPPSACSAVARCVPCMCLTAFARSMLAEDAIKAAVKDYKTKKSASA